MSSQPPFDPARPLTAANLPAIDMSHCETRYVNFCRVTGTPEEMIIDLGLQTADHAADPIWQAPQRITLNFFTAKRLLDALVATLRQYEATFGNVETDVDKRLKSNPR